MEQACGAQEFPREHDGDGEHPMLAASKSGKV